LLIIDATCSYGKFTVERPASIGRLHAMFHACMRRRIAELRNKRYLCFGGESALSNQPLELLHLLAMLYS
jgi:hypothetical protein